MSDKIDPVKRREDFVAAAFPLMKWMAENLHPHHTAVITSTTAELSEGLCSSGFVQDFIKD